MPKNIITACLLALSVTPAATAQILSYDDILKNLSGDWAVPFDETEGGKRITDCAQLRISISIENRDDGFYYVAQHKGLNAEGFPEHEQPVQQARRSNGTLLPALLIEYENETRLDEKGNPIGWWLFMLDKDSFTWSATHWNFGSTTPARTRCMTDPGA